MCVHYIEVEIEREPVADLHIRIEEALGEEGEPLRWAVTAVPDQGPLRVEAVVSR